MEHARTQQVDVAVIGAGFGGLGMGIALKTRSTRSFVIVEKGHTVGGTWRENTYPGAACDVPSHLYSFSFHPGRWTRRYPPQPEILAYLEETAAHYGLGPHLRLDTEVTGVHFRDHDGRWTVTLHDGSTIDAAAVVSAVGQLNRPRIPHLEGADTFAGPAFHSARWRHDVDLTGKRVGVIGTGASAIQFVPHVVRDAAHVSLFQRSAPYVIEKPDRPYHPIERFAFQHVPGARLVERGRIFLKGEVGGQGILGHKGIRKAMTKIWSDYCDSQVTDPELRAKCTPDYVIGCKRVLFANDWYSSISQPHVDVVTEGIERIEPAGVRTAGDQLHELDVLIWGTGFAATGFLQPMEVTGRHGRSLRDEWQEGAYAHLGIMAHGYPNLFMLYGPNTNLGSNSIVFMLETQIRWIEQALATLDEHDAAWLEPRLDAQQAFRDWVAEASTNSSWEGGCDSWYLTDGVNTNNWPAATYAYRHRLRRFDPLDLHLQPAAALAEASSPARSGAGR